MQNRNSQRRRYDRLMGILNWFRPSVVIESREENSQAQYRSHCPQEDYTSPWYTDPRTAHEEEAGHVLVKHYSGSRRTGQERRGSSEWTDGFYYQ